MSESEPVGSVSEEAFKLFRALSSAGSDATSDEAHACTTPHSSKSWCPMCQVVGLVRDNPEMVAQVSASAAALAKSLRDLVESTVPSKDGNA